MPKRLDLQGQTFGMLTVRKQGPHRGVSIQWDCQCECGKTFLVLAGALRSGNTRSCGCVRSESLRKRSTIHGFAAKGRKSYEYTSWMNAKNRCYNEKNPKYKNYGARGITMCDRWLYDFSAFLSDMGERPDGLTLERNDVNGNYDPSNCRWATYAEQFANKTDNVFVQWKDERITLSALARLEKLNYYSLHWLFRRAGHSLNIAVARAKRSI